MRKLSGQLPLNTGVLRQLRRQLRHQEAAERADRNRLLKLRRHKIDEGTARRALTFVYPTRCSVISSRTTIR
jgi:hypothetical protein